MSATRIVVGAAADARDLLGRPGVGLTRSEDAFDTRTVVIVDPATGETIGARYLMATPAGDEVFGAIAVVARGIADVVGRMPDVVVRSRGPGRGVEGTADV